LPVEVVVVAITWNAAARRAGLTDDDMLTLSASSESGYSPEVVQRFLDALPKPPAPKAPLRPTPRVLYVDREVAGIVQRNPHLFGQGQTEA